MVEHRQFFNRRLHSLLGVVPIGLFVVQHLIINHFAVYGEESFNKAAGFMGSLPFVIVLEIFVIYLPILFHAVLGVMIVFEAKDKSKNVASYGFFRNWMFMLQRITGVITLVFIAFHVWQTRVQVAIGGATVDYQMMEGILTNFGWFIAYAIGVLATIFHFANGLWSFLVTWGIAQSPRSQRIATYFSVGVFLVVGYIGVRTLIQFGFGI